MRDGDSGGNVKHPFGVRPGKLGAAVAVRGMMDTVLHRSGVRRLRMPDILGIGAQKSGTSWLHHQLASHPEIAMARPKELHYFDEHRWAPLSRYAGKFVEAERQAGGSTRLVGEITPAYSILDARQIARVRLLMPGVKIIFLMRHPVDRAWSAARMVLARREKRPVESVAVGEYLRVLGEPGFVARGDYLCTLDRWLAAFPAEQVYVDFFDRIEAEPAELMADICRFLGVADDPGWADGSLAEPRFEGVAGEMPGEVRAYLEGLYAEPVRRLGERFPEMPRSWLVRGRASAPG